MELTEAQKTALKVAQLSVMDMPKDLMEYHDRIWEACTLGRMYEYLTNKEKESK